MPSPNFLARRSLSVRCLSSLPASQNQPGKRVKVLQVELRQAVAVRVGETLVVDVDVVGLVAPDQDVEAVQ